MPCRRPSRRSSASLTPNSRASLAVCAASSAWALIIRLNQTFGFTPGAGCKAGKGAGERWGSVLACVRGAAGFALSDEFSARAPLYTGVFMGLMTKVSGKLAHLVPDFLDLTAAGQELLNKFVQFLGLLPLYVSIAPRRIASR